MARQSKKIAKKLKPKQPTETQDKQPDKKVGKDYLLIIVFALTLVFLIVGWSNFSPLNRGLYLALAVSLSATYARRHYNLSPTQDLWVERAGFASMTVAIVCFAAVVYFQYFAS